MKPEPDEIDPIYVRLVNVVRSMSGVSVATTAIALKESLASIGYTIQPDEWIHFAERTIKRMTVFEADGKYMVKADKRGVVIAGPFSTSSEAWRWIDRSEGEPISRAEKTAEYIWLKSVES